LNSSLDSLRKTNDSAYKRLDNYYASYLHYTGIPDSIWKKAPDTAAKYSSFDKYIPDSTLNIINDAAISIANGLRNDIQNTGTEIETRKTDIRFHKVEWHRKFSLSLACLVLFFIGAPLGSIIRKGGLGMPLVVAIIFFLIFHLLNMFGEKFVKEGIASPLIGMWLAVIVLVPIGIFLTYKAMHDSQLFSKEFYYRSFKKLRPLFSIFNRTK
jgi:lipopolysaccharide export system permease protein